MSTIRAKFSEQKRNIGWKDDNDWQEVKNILLGTPKVSVTIQKKNHTGYRNAASLTMKMHITDARKRKIKMVSIKWKLDIVENGRGKEKGITNQ